MSGTLRTGLWRNPLGAELHVTNGYFTMRDLGSSWQFLSDDIYVGERRDDLFGSSWYLVTEASLASAGYEFGEADR